VFIDNTFPIDTFEFGSTEESDGSEGTSRSAKTVCKKLTEIDDNFMIFSSRNSPDLGVTGFSSPGFGAALLALAEHEFRIKERIRSHSKMQKVNKEGYYRVNLFITGISTDIDVDDRFEYCPATGRVSCPVSDNEG